MVACFLILINQTSTMYFQMFGVKLINILPPQLSAIQVGLDSEIKLYYMIRSLSIIIISLSHFIYTTL